MPLFLKKPVVKSKSIKKQIKANDKFPGKKKSGFVDSGFVKTCDELVIGLRAT